jgi:hypothetical protein
MQRRSISVSIDWQHHRWVTHMRRPRCCPSRGGP